MTDYSEIKRLVDPGANARTREEAKALREAAWKRPKDRATRDRLRADRIAVARGGMGG